MPPTALLSRRTRRAGARLAIAVAIGIALLALLVVVAFMGALGALDQPCGEGSAAFAPSGEARNGIPESYLALYLAAGEEYGGGELGWEDLAGVGKVESDHGRSTLPGVQAGSNFAGAQGPMQFLAATWAQYGVDGDGDGDKDVYDPRDAIPGAANYLRALGGREDIAGALFGYNHSAAYVAEVERWANGYRGTPTRDLAAPAASAAAPCPGGAGAVVGTANAGEVLSNPNVRLTAIQRSDIEQGLIDPRVLGVLDYIAQDHTVTVTALASDHAPGTNHEAGRAVDIGAIDGVSCVDTAPSSPCGRVALDLAEIRGEMHSTELIYCFDPDGDPANPDAFARSDHCDHIHAGWDA